MANLLDIVTRHQIYLEGVKNGFAVDFEKNYAYILVIELKKLFATLEYTDLGDMSKGELAKFLKALTELNKTVFGQYTEQAIKSIMFFMDVDKELSEELLKDDDSSLIFLLSSAKLWSKISNTPMGATGTNILPTLAAFGSLSARNIENFIRKAWINKESVADTLRQLIGTKSGDYKDGELGKIGRQNRSTIGTIIQHVSAEVQASIGAIFYDEYMWSSIIDNSTTDVCRNRNGQIFRYGKGPLPPAHIGCRSKIVPLDRTSPRAEPPGFGVWAASQPSAFLKDAFIGKPANKSFPPLTIKQFGAKAKFITATA